MKIDLTLTDGQYSASMVVLQDEGDPNSTYEISGFGDTAGNCLRNLAGSVDSYLLKTRLKEPPDA